SAPFSPILAHLAHPVAAILNEKAVTEAAADYGLRVAVGTGPFRFVDWVTQSHVTLERFDDYWGEPAKVERVVIRAIPEGTVRAIELETGGVDIAYDLEPIDRMRLEFNPNIKIFANESLSASYVGFNMQKAPFDNPLVRQAVNYAIDVEPLVEVIYSGQAVQAFGPLSPKVFGAHTCTEPYPYDPQKAPFDNPMVRQAVNDAIDVEPLVEVIYSGLPVQAFGPLSPKAFGAHTELEPYPYDPQKARERLAEAGYPNGFRTSIWTNENPLRIQIAEALQQNLADIGVQADVEIVEWGAYLENTGAGLHDKIGR